MGCAPHLMQKLSWGLSKKFGGGKGTAQWLGISFSPNRLEFDLWIFSLPLDEQRVLSLECAGIHSYINWVFGPATLTDEIKRKFGGRLIATA